MRKNLFRKVVVALLVFVVAFTSTMPSNAFAMSLGKRAGGFKLNFAKTLPNDNGATAKKLLYGDDDTEYALGAAAHFALFASDLNVYATQDCEGRAAADELYLTSIYGDYADYKFSGLMTTGVLESDTATIICNNSISKRFGRFINPDCGGGRAFVTSTDVTKFENVYGNTAQLEANTYKVAPNSIIDFPAEMAYLQETSQLFRSIGAGESKITESDGNVDCVFTGTDSKLNVFTISETEWKKMASVTKNFVFDISVPDNSYIIFNVGGKDITVFGRLKESITLNTKKIEQDKDKPEAVKNCLILFNFYEAESIKISNGTVGNLLAPLAEIESMQVGSHNNGQVVGRKITLSNEQGPFGFTMPKSYIPKPAYTAHYMYYDVNGEMKEMSSELYNIFIGRENAPNAADDKFEDAYQAGNNIKAVGDNTEIDEAIEAFKSITGMELFAKQYENGCPIRFAVYEDGTNWNNAKTGNTLLTPETYSKMTRKPDISWGEQYDFDKSNVYFIMYPTAKVTVDVSWDDKLNKSGRRPDDFEVTLIENIPNAENTAKDAKEQDEQELLENETTKETDDILDPELNKKITYEKYSDGFVYYIPLFGKQADSKGQDSDYTYGTTVGKFGEDGLFDIDYEVPEYYKDVTVTRVDKNGSTPVDEEGVVAQFHIVLRGEYKAQFFIIDENGNRKEVLKENFYNANNDDYDTFRGYGNTGKLPGLTSEEFDSYFEPNANRKDYAVLWKDISDGKYYEMNKSGSTYEFDYEDVVFEANVRRAETLTNHPWLFTHVISYHESHYIPGNMIWKRLEMDHMEYPEAGGFTFIQKNDKTDYSYDTTKAGKYDDEKFLMLTFAFGVDCTRAKATKVTVAKDGFGDQGTIIYTAEKLDTEADGGCEFTFQPMKDFDALSIAEMVPKDYYISDYEGLRQFSLALPVDVYETENLFFTVYYYDENGQESVWFNYVLNLESNPMWTVVKEPVNVGPTAQMN